MVEELIGKTVEVRVVREGRITPVRLIPDEMTNR
jgi:hypothetical protein